MPRSSKAPPLPPEPDINELVQNDVARIKRLLGLDVNRLALGSEVEGLITTPFGTNDYTIIGPHVIEFVNVSTSLGPAQGGSGFPAQVTGLTVTPHAGSDTQLDLAWTAITAPDFNYYNVYRGITSGFTVDSSSEIAQPVTNSYNNTGLSPGTIYYYRVSVTNDAELEGTPSSQVSGTTTGSAPIFPSLELHLDSAFTDTSPNVHAVSGSNGNGFVTPGKFGGAGWKCNFPTTTAFDFLSPANTTNPPTLQMDTAVGFSMSFWINPQDLTTLSFRRVLWERPEDVNNKWSIQIEGSTAYFFVKKAGVEYKRQKTGFVTGSWQHVAAVFNGATNTVELYRDGVAGATSAATGQYPYASSEGGGSPPAMMIGYRASGVPAPYGSGANTMYMGYYDEIRYYKSIVLTSTQVTNLMNTNAT